MTQRFEHLVLPFAELAVDVIRTAEKDGWELVTIAERNCYFKRPYIMAEPSKVYYCNGEQVSKEQYDKLTAYTRIKRKSWMD